MNSFFYWQQHSLILCVHIHAGAREDAVREPQGGYLKIAISKPAVDGKANQQLCRLLARELKTPVSRIRIISGLASRRKRVSIDNPCVLPFWLQDSALVAQSATNGPASSRDTHTR